MMDKAKILNIDFPAEFIIFDINPKTISFQKTVPYNAQTTTQPNVTLTCPGYTPPTLGPMKPMELKVNELYMDGVLCKHYADMLFAWTQPNGSFLQQAIFNGLAAATGNRGNVNANTPMLMFQWGPPVFGFVMKCRLANLDVTFTRFSPLGTPTRMKVGITLREEFDAILFALTNPTSGGRPGRAGHMVTEGENLQHLSKKHYGQPGMWRALAEVNGIDDPLRVRAGENVYLPSAEETSAAMASGR